MRWSGWIDMGGSVGGGTESGPEQDMQRAVMRLCTYNCHSQQQSGSSIRAPET